MHSNLRIARAQGVPRRAGIVLVTLLAYQTGKEIPCDHTFYLILTQSRLVSRDLQTPLMYGFTDTRIYEPFSLLFRPD